MKYLLILLFGISAHAQEQWRCTSDSSEIKGNQFYACGVGESRHEGVAREHAFLRSQNEFVSLCNLSTDCKKKHVSIDPGRTTCEQISSGAWKCYRLLIFTLD